MKKFFILLVQVILVQVANEAVLGTKINFVHFLHGLSNFFTHEKKKKEGSLGKKCCFFVEEKLQRNHQNETLLMF